MYRIATYDNRYRINRSTEQIWISILFQVIVSISFSWILTSIGFSKDNPWIMGIIWIIFVTTWTIEGITAVSNDIFELFILLLSYICKVYMILRLTLSTSPVTPTLSGDAIGFWRVATQYYYGDFNTVYTGYPYILNTLFHIFGINYICCLIANVFMMTLSTLIVCDIMNKIGVTGSTRRITLVMSAMLPYTFIIATSIWRESIYVLCFTISLSFYVDYAITGNYRRLILASASVLPAIALHGGYFPIIVVCFTIGRRRREGGFLKGDIFPPLICILLTILFLSISTRTVGSRYVTNGLTNPEDFLDRLAGREGGSTANSAYLVGLRADTWRKAIIYTPIRVLYYLASPMPMDWRGIIDIVTFLFDSTFHLVLLMLSQYCFSLINRTKAIEGYNYKFTTDDLYIDLLRTTLACTLLCAVVFAVGTSAAGTAIRHRDAMVTIEVVGIMSAIQIIRSNKHDETSSTNLN